MHRMMIRQRHEAQSEAQARRALRERRQYELGLGGMRIARREVVLDQPHAVQAEPVREFDLGHAVGKYFRFASAERGRHRKLVEEVEKQGQLPLVCKPWLSRYIASDPL